MAEVRLLTEPRNYAVVQLPERRFPGIVFQGDSLQALIKDLEVVLVEPTATAGVVRDVIDRLCEVRTFYEATLERHGIELPYIRD